MGRNGKSRALICFVLCMIMALPVYFSSAVAVKAAEQQTIIIGTNAEYSPFEYLDDDGNITGFDYDLLAMMEGSPVIQLAEAPAVKSMEQIAAEIRIFFMKPTPFTMSYLYYS